MSAPSVRVVWFAMARDAAGGTPGEDVSLADVVAFTQANLQKASTAVSITDPLAHSPINSSTTTFHYTHPSESQLQSQPQILLSQLLAFVLHRHPDLETILQTAMIAVNMEYVDKDNLWEKSSLYNNVAIRPGDEVAVIPPVSGG